jgi:hypothetical protein
MSDVVGLTARIGGPEGIVIRVAGRFAWTLSALVAAGDGGITPLERPAPRWSHYVHRLRRAGVPIETIVERHQGAFAGRHGRYRLACAVEILSEVRT